MIHPVFLPNKFAHLNKVKHKGYKVIKPRFSFEVKTDDLNRQGD